MSKLDENLQKKYDEWMKLDPFDHSRKELEEMLKTPNMEKELNYRLGKRIAFGTAGLRSRMTVGWNCMNDLIIVQTTQGLVKYIEKVIPDCKSRGVLIGFDHRKLGPYSSKRFCELTAAVFLHSGWKVYMFPEYVGTPFVPFGIHFLKCACGIMMTASHNPAPDNGYKLYWENGCQIIAPHDSGIQESIMQAENQKLWDGLNFGEKLWEACVDPTKDLVDEYYKQTTKFQFRTSERNSQSKTKLVYTAMHGIGAKWVSLALKKFGFGDYIETPSQQAPDHTFPTATKPNPEEDGTLVHAKKVAEENGVRCVIANDPDADRLAVAELQRDGKTWVKLNGNEIAILLASWVWENYKRVYKPEDPSKCVMINSTVSSKLLKGLADFEGFSYDETLTGFKWIGNKGVEYSQKGYSFLFGYEVEIGFVVGDMSFDKDGVRVAPIFYEMVDWCYEQDMLLTERLTKIYDTKTGYYNMRTKYFFADSEEKKKIVYEKLRTPSYPTHCGDYKIKSVRDLTISETHPEGYDNSKPNNKPVLPVTSGQMITFTFEDGSTSTLRNSGTEPKVKWYVECKGKTKEEAEKKSFDLSKAVIDNFIKPGEYGLEYPEGWKLE